MISVAILHLDLCRGPESKNLEKLLTAIDQAGQMGADWVLTPETALQGYFWAVDGAEKATLFQSKDFLNPISELSKRYQMTTFFCSAEKCLESQSEYNSCFAISPDGDVLGKHRKIRGHGSAEAWAARGLDTKVLKTSPLSAGILICADSWYEEYAADLRNGGAEVIVVPAAWPPGEYGPGDCWEKRSFETGLPVWVCNQTGKHTRLDFTDATSVVVQNGKTVLSYKGKDEAILLFDWDVKRNALLGKEWVIKPLDYS